MKKLLTIILLTLFFIGCSSDKISDINTKLLEHCKNELLQKNKDLLVPPPVGSWKSLADIEVIYNGGRRIEVIYYFKRGYFKEETRQDLDSMQYRIAKNAGCNYMDVGTTAKVNYK